MKACTYCSAQNWDDARVCYQCGRDLPTWVQPSTPEDNPEPTQPNRVYRYDPPPGITQPLPYPAETRRHPQPVYPTLPTAPEPDPIYLPTDAPPPPTLDRPRGSSRLWPVYLLVLGIILGCVGGFAVWTIFSTPFNGAPAGIRLPLGAASILPSPTSEPGAIPIEPSPWPTFTPQPEAQPTPTLDPTQEAGLEKLLSPECASALDYLSSFSEQARSNPTKLLDSTWREELSRAATQMKASCGSLDAASPVPGMIADARTNLDQANTELDEASRLFQEGVDEFKPAMLLDAGKHVLKAADYLNQAVNELQKIGR